MDSLSLISIYLATKTVTVVVEEIFYSIDENSFIARIQRIYHQYISEGVHIGVKVAWSNLPSALVINLISEERIILMLAKLLLKDVHLPTEFPTEGWNSLEKSIFFSPIHVLLLSCLIGALRIKGIVACDYLKQRVPVPLGHVLDRLKNSLDQRPFIQRYF